MKPTAREVLFIKIGAIAAAVCVTYLLVLNPLRRNWVEARGAYQADRTAFLALKKNVSARLQLDRSIAALEKKLHAKVQKGSVDEQKQAFVKNVEQTAAKCKAKITGINPRNAPGQRKQSAPQPGSKAAYSLSAETDQPGLLRFLKALDEMENPVVITDFEAKTNAKDPNKLQVALDFYTYLFDGWNPLAGPAPVSQEVRRDGKLEGDQGLRSQDRLERPEQTAERAGFPHSSF